MAETTCHSKAYSTQSVNVEIMLSNRYNRQSFRFESLE